MLIDEIKAGESKFLEFKVEVPNKSEKYMKTVVAFANGVGGKIIFGVDDKTHEIVGIDANSVYETMDAISNAISDSCEPMILADIGVSDINGKKVIVVEVNPGSQKPYFIKSLGMFQGTFVRIGATSHPAGDYMIRELMFEGANRYYDQTTFAGYTVTDEEINQLCYSLKETALKNCKSEEEERNLKDVTKSVLLNWGVLCEKEGVILPTVAFALLTGNEKIIPFMYIQCGIFKGDNRSIFLDRKEYHGPLQDVLDEAYQFVLRNLRMGAKIEGLYRQDIYELPVNSIRELILNAILHRSYLNPSNIQIALYDNRLEITSPGGLVQGVTINKMKEGYSRPRNRALLYAFTYMKIFEGWGSGIPRIIREFERQNLQTPEFIDWDGDVRVNLYRSIEVANQTTQTTHSTTQTTQLTTQTTQLCEFIEDLQENDIILIKLLIENPSITQKGIAEQLSWTIDLAKYYLKKLKKIGLIEHIGTSRKGSWVVHLNDKL